MSEFLLHYERVDPTTWVYLSSLLSLGLFFKFNRFWSVRNLDLILLILLAPGLLLVHDGRVGQRRQINAAVKAINASDSHAKEMSQLTEAMDMLAKLDPDSPAREEFEQAVAPREFTPPSW